MKSQSSVSEIPHPASHDPQLPLVSIVTPSLNQGPFIEATIRSVLDQNYPNIEYVVMDGGSTDDTSSILRRYENRLRWISEKDEGQSDAVNKGMARTSGEIVTWLNSDDTLTAGAIQTAVDYLLAHPDVAMVYGDADFIDPAGRFIRRCAHVEPYSRRRLRHYSDFIVQPAAFFRRSAFDAVGGLDASLHYAMDYDLWLKLAERFEIAYLPGVLAHYRWLGTNKSAEGGRKRLAEVGRVAANHGIGSLPAYFRLESVALNMSEAAIALRRMQLIRDTMPRRCCGSGGMSASDCESLLAANMESHLDGSSASAKCAKNIRWMMLLRPHRGQGM